MDTDYEIRQIEFEETYFALYGEYPEDLNPDDFGDYTDYKEERKERTAEVRRYLGWR